MSLLAAGLIAAALLVALVRERARSRELAQRVERQALDLERLQVAFGRFAPESVVNEIAATGQAMDARECEVTVLFADLKGFTAMSDRLAPAIVVDVLNGYFSRMSEAVTANRGQISKFIGDGLMALFGVPQNNVWQSNDAVRAALEMRRALAEYNVELARRNLAPLAFGIGIHRGRAVAGILGSDRLMEYTVIGDTVNVASRVESMTRQHGVDVIVTDSVKAALDCCFRLVPLAPTMVKGKPEPIIAFAVVDDGAGPTAPAASEQRG